MKFHRRLIGSESVCAEEDAMTPPSYAMRFHAIALLFGARAWESTTMPLALLEDITGNGQRTEGSVAALLRTA